MRARLSRLPAFVPAIVIAIAGWAHRWMNEDAYIFMRIAEQILAGHGPVFNAGERIEASTSPVWLAILVVGRAVFGPFVRSEWIAVVAALATAVLAFGVAGLAAHRAHRDDQGVVIPVGLLLVAAVTVVWDFSTSGLEMGLVWLWIALSWYALVSAVRDDEITGRRRNAWCLVLGLAPLVRPDLALMMVPLLVAWLALVRPRRITRDLAVMFALPVAYQVFRMGYYASLVPSTALAKDAGGLHVRQGWDYAADFVGAYHLWLTALLVVAVLALWHVRNSDRRLAIATVALLVGGGLHGLYIVLIGGDYMHGRLLLPAFFALALPASIAIDRTSRAALALGAAAVAWATVSLVAFRPPPAPESISVAGVADWRTVSGAKIVLDDVTYALNGREVGALYAGGARGYLTVYDLAPRPGKDPNLLVFTLGSIGAPAYNAGRHVWIVDIGGLAEPLAARTADIPDRPAGHRKQVATAWYDARFTPPSPSDAADVVAARHALECGPGADLLDAVNDDLTPGRFLSNLWHSVSYTRMFVPADPIEAERLWCR